MSCHASHTEHAYHPVGLWVERGLVLYVCRWGFVQQNTCNAPLLRVNSSLLRLPLPLFRRCWPRICGADMRRRLGGRPGPRGPDAAPRLYLGAERAAAAASAAATCANVQSLQNHSACVVVVVVVCLYHHQLVCIHCAYRWWGREANARRVVCTWAAVAAHELPLVAACATRVVVDVQIVRCHHCNQIL